MTSDTPRAVNFAASANFPVLATTSKPSFTSKAQAMIPTPPVAPVTSTFPASGVMPLSNSLFTQSPAVRPAVPSTIESCKDKPTGNLVTHPPGTVTCCPNPPAVFMPRSYPVTTTSSPTAKFESVLARTVPAASIPGTCGYSRVTALLPEADRASL